MNRRFRGGHPPIGWGDGTPRRAQGRGECGDGYEAAVSTVSFHFHPQSVPLKLAPQAVEVSEAGRLQYSENDYECPADLADFYSDIGVATERCCCFSHTPLNSIEPEGRLEDLSDRGQGHRFDDSNAARHRGTLSDFVLAMSQKLGFARGHFRAQLHVGNRHLAFVAVRLADRGRMHDSRMCEKRSFNHKWVDVMPPPG